MTLVIGTAGHIDHGKTSLLRALTGIDADRLPEERRRGMTIDVGYAHLALEDGTELDFVDVPGHDRLVGNMLVGAGEIDAALLVVAADDGPRAQTLEHLELLDALGVEDGIAVVTKLDLLSADDPRREDVPGEVARLLGRSALTGIPVVAVSCTTGEGLADARSALVALRERVLARLGSDRRPTRLSIDRVFAARGRGAVATGTLRGGPLEIGLVLRLEPGATTVRTPTTVRIRGMQVHGRPVERFAGGGRVALNLAGIETAALRRGLVLTTGPAVVATDRLAAAIRPPAPIAGAARHRALGHGATVRLHVGTDQVDATVRRSRRDATTLPGGEEIVRLALARPVAAAAGDRFVLRWPSPAATAAAGRILDTAPPVGISRRRADPERLRALGEADGPTEAVTALVALHGVLARPRAIAVLAAHGGDESALAQVAGVDGPTRTLAAFLVASDIVTTLEGEALERVAGHHASQPLSGGLPLSELRPIVGRALRRLATTTAGDAGTIAGALVEGLIDAGRLARSGDLVRDPSRSAALPDEVLAAMDRLEAALGVAAPPPFVEAVRASGCPPEGVRALESTGRIVRLDPDLAYAAATYGELEALALRMSAAGPLAPAAFRDATGTSRKYSLAVLEDLDRRGLLRRTADGHVLGARAPRDG